MAETDRSPTSNNAPLASARSSNSDRQETGRVQYYQCYFYFAHTSVVCLARHFTRTLWRTKDLERMGACCSSASTSVPLTAEQKAELKDKQLRAAEERQKDFKQGGGGIISMCDTLVCAIVLFFKGCTHTYVRMMYA